MADGPPAYKGAKSAGKVIVGITTFVMVVILVSGIVIWIPRTRKALRNRLVVSCTKGWWRFWYDSHVSLGIYVTLFLLVMALTGLHGRSNGTARQPMDCSVYRQPVPPCPLRSSKIRMKRKKRQSSIMGYGIMWFPNCRPLSFVCLHFADGRKSTDKQAR